MALLGLTGAPGAEAAPEAPAYGAASQVCVVSDPRIDEGSGLLRTATGFDVMNDGGTRVEVFHLDGACAVTGSTVARIDPYDTEDLALGPDGRYWVGDVGDNDATRTSVAVEVLDGGPGDVTATAFLRRFTYPDGPHDAEALLAEADGRVVVVTKEVLGGSGVYQSSTPLDTSPSGTDAPQPLRKVGVLQLAVTDTPGGPIGLAGNLTVTGAATSPDRTLIALRTYTDAYVWTVPTGRTFAQTIAEGRPARVALPDEPQGEAIALGPDRAMYLFGEGVGQPVWSLPYLPGPEPANSSAAPAASAGSEPAAADREIDPPPSSGTVIAVAVTVAVALGLLVAVVVRRPGRRRRRRPPRALEPPREVAR